MKISPEFTEALAKLCVGMASVPIKETPAKAEMMAAQEKIIPAAYNMALPGPDSPEERLKRFEDSLKPLRLACYSQVRLYTELIELLDTAQAEISKALKNE